MHRWPIRAEQAAKCDAGFVSAVARVGRNKPCSCKKQCHFVIFSLFFFYWLSSALISWSSTQVLVDYWGTFCAGDLPMPIFRCYLHCCSGVRTPILNLLIALPPLFTPGLLHVFSLLGPSVFENNEAHGARRTHFRGKAHVVQTCAPDVHTFFHSILIAIY